MYHMHVSLQVSDGSPLLLSLAKRFEVMGMVTEAVDCYIRSGNSSNANPAGAGGEAGSNSIGVNGGAEIKAAIDCCVTLNK